MCPACARNRKSPLYQVSLGSFAAASAIGLAAAAFGGWLVSSLSLGPFFELVCGFGYGTAIGEIVLRVTGRKRGLRMEVLAGVLAAAGLLIGELIHTSGHALPQGVDFVSHYLTNPMAIVMFAVSAFGAVNRVRFVL